MPPPKHTRRGVPTVPAAVFKAGVPTVPAAISKAGVPVVPDAVSKAPPPDLTMVSGPVVSKRPPPDMGNRDHRIYRGNYKAAGAPPELSQVVPPPPVVSQPLRRWRHTPYGSDDTVPSASGWAA